MGALTGGSPAATDDFWYSSVFGGRTTTSGETINEQKALTLSSYYACIKVLSEDVAKLPLGLFIGSEARTSVAAPMDHPVNAFLRDMNPNTTDQAIRETITNHAAGWGVGLAEIQRDNAGRPIALWPIHPSRVTARCVSGELVWDVLIDDCDHDLTREPGTTVRLLDEEVFVIRGIGTNGYVGYSVLQYGAESIGLSLAAQKFGSAFFGNGAMPSIIIKYPGRLKPDAAIALRESWQNSHQGVAQARRPVVMEEGAEVDTLSINPDDGQFLETRQFQVEEICRWFRMPPVKIQHNQNTPYSNIESLDRAYVKDTLSPWMLRWEKEGRRKLILKRERDALYFFDHDVEQQLRGDPKTQAEVDRTNVAAGIDSINEVRNRKRLGPIEGGDAHFMQQGFTTVDAVASGENLKQSNPAPAPTPEPEQDDDESEKDDSSASVVFMPMVAAIAERMVSRELNAVTRAEKKFAGRSDQCHEWAESFFNDHSSVMSDSFAPVAEAWLTLTGKDRRSGVDTACKAYATSHLKRWAKAAPTAEKLTSTMMTVLEN